MTKDTQISTLRTTRSGLSTILGALFWLGFVVGMVLLYTNKDPDQVVTHRISDHLFSDLQTFEVEFPLSAVLTADEAIKVDLDEGFFAAGRVLSVARYEHKQVATLVIYPEYATRVSDKSELYAARTSGDISWILKTLLPADQKEFIIEVLMKRWNAERAGLIRDLKPGLADWTDDAIKILSADFDAVFEKHHQDFKIMGQVVQERGWNDEIEPLIAELVWPAIEAQSLPILSDLGDEVVDAFPLWTMSWAYIVQTLPFGSDDRLKTKLNDFLQEKAIPIIESKTPEFRSMALKVLRDSARNDRSIEAFKKGAQAIAEDPRFRAALGRIAKAWVVDNPRMQELVKDAWKRESLRRPLERVFSRMDSDVRRIANSILMNKEHDGINPDLARVLRRRLLRRNENWILLKLGEGQGGKPTTTIPGFDGGIR